MRKKGIVLLIIVMTQILTGCWSRVEVNDLSIVTATALDKIEGGKIRLTLQIAVPRMLGQVGSGGGGGGGRGSGGEKKSTVTVSENGETVLDAFRRLQEKLPRKLFFSHSRIIIIGEQLARDGVSPVLDFFSRYREARLHSYILFTKGEASDILNIPPKWEKISSEEIREEEKSHIGVSIYLVDFLDMLLTDGVEPIAALVEPKSTEVKKKSDSESGQSPPESEKSVVIAGAAVFRKDKLIGWMNGKEARGALWLRNELKQAVITVTIPEEMGNGKVSAKLLKGESKFKPILKNNKLIMKVEIRAQDDLYENSSKLDLNKPDAIKYVQKKLEEDIEKRIQIVLDKTQKQFKSDVFGFGTAVYRTYPKAWKKKFKDRWDQEFPELEVKIAAHVRVVRTGLTNKSITLEDKEFIK
ncbi:Ger(x)C family spore germination protein [Cohnella silvisoli]|uniref:Ger(X)C family spore germination protein n=1 Tax=Cohnella silvisoli TaxID=2873699 RepID=A0ABV1KV86_9BACL|nr:Ger(x)C family spore germination protein [Cohnella silvisoli]MCD9022870.1 Ger(x)C family spore germination protein [Cohnella silvisoli]